MSRRSVTAATPSVALSSETRTVPLRCSARRIVARLLAASSRDSVIEAPFGGNSWLQPGGEDQGRVLVANLLGLWACRAGQP
jgi:hypothetical protein